MKIKSFTGYSFGDIMSQIDWFYRQNKKIEVVSTTHTSVYYGVLNKTMHYFTISYKE